MSPSGISRLSLGRQVERTSTSVHGPLRHGRAAVQWQQLLEADVKRLQLGLKPSSAIGIEQRSPGTPAKASQITLLAQLRHRLMSGRSRLLGAKRPCSAQAEGIVGHEITFFRICS